MKKLLKTSLIGLGLVPYIVLLMAAKLPPYQSAGMYVSPDNGITWSALAGTVTAALGWAPQKIALYISSDGGTTWGPWNGGATGGRIASGYCTGTATSSTTLSVINLGSNNFACTGTSGAAGMLLLGTGTLSNLAVRCQTTGISASSGVFTLSDLRNGTNTVTPLTVTYGTTAAGTTVQDTTDTYAFQNGDMLRVNFTTQATETLANCDVSFNY